MKIIIIYIHMRKKSSVIKVDNHAADNKMWQYPLHAVQRYATAITIGDIHVHGEDNKNEETYFDHDRT